MKKETARALKSTAKKVEAIREKEAALWAQLRNQMREAYEEAQAEEEKALAEGKTFDPAHRVTYIEIGKAVGLTKARVYQLISGKRSGRKPVADPQSQPNPEVDGLSRILDSVESESPPESLTESGESSGEESWLEAAIQHVHESV